MKINAYRVMIAACLLMLAGCQGGDSSTRGQVIQMPTGKAKPAETVNGTRVPEALLKAVAKSHHLDLDKPEQRARAFEALTNYVLLAQEAKRQGWTSDPGFQADAEVARLQAVAEAAFGKLGEQTPISGSMLKTEYDAEVKRTGKLSYDFSQLLFDNQDDALKAEGEILSGKPFSKVYEEWHDKAKQARSFSRVRLDQVPPALAKALAGLKNGETTKLPVKTEYGWHIVHLDIANPFSPPPFDQVKQGIRHSMQVKIARQRLDKLREEAAVSYPPGSKPPAKPAAASSAPSRDSGAGQAAKPASPLSDQGGSF